ASAGYTARRCGGSARLSPAARNHAGAISNIRHPASPAGRLGESITAWPRAHRDTTAVLLIFVAALVPRLLFMFRAPALFVVGSRPYYATALQVATGLDVTAL